MCCPQRLLPCKDIDVSWLLLGRMAALCVPQLVRCNDVLPWSFATSPPPHNWAFLGHAGPGPFTLEIDGGVSAFQAARPAVVMLSSGGVERNALIGDDEEARKRDIPIVQLNPGGAGAALAAGGIGAQATAQRVWTSQCASTAESKPKRCSHHLCCRRADVCIRACTVLHSTHRPCACQTC